MSYVEIQVKLSIITTYSIFTVFNYDIR